jgi:plasmid stabilization system protein ParE
MQCVFSPLAEFDLEEIGDYIARDNPARAWRRPSHDALWALLDFLHGKFGKYPH